MQFHDHESSVFRFSLSVFNFALGLFCKKCNVPLWMLMNIDRKEKRKSLNMPDANFFGKKKVFHVIITSTLIFYPLCFADILQKNCNFFFLIFIQFFLYLPFHQKNKFCSEFIWNTSVKKKKQQQQTNQQNKTKAANSVYFSSITSRITLLLSIYFVFFLHLECR